MSKSHVFLIHGTLGSPMEFEPVRAFLDGLGYEAHLVSLPGHGPRPRKPLHTVRGHDILNHCHLTVQNKIGPNDRIFLIGHSLGGMCALVLAEQLREHVNGVITFASPYEHAVWVNRPQALAQIPLDSMVPAVMYARQGYTGLDQPFFNPVWLPRLRQESQTVFSEVQKAVPRITAPAFLAHSPHDVIVPYGEMNKLATNLQASPTVETYSFSECGHQIFPQTRETQNALALIESFIKTHERASA